MTRKYYRKLSRVTYLWHGYWSDPTLRYKKHEFNYWDIEDMFYDMMNDDIECGDYKPTSVDDDVIFNEWLSLNKDRCYCTLDELVMYQDEETREFHAEYLNK